jgi:hypothetical protein
MAPRFHVDARTAFQEASSQTQQDATPILDLLSAGFEITWFRETGPRLWLAAAKPGPEVSGHFGLALECFVIGNGYPTDFQQRTLLHEPPAELFERLDRDIRFVASDAPLAEATCAAWAATKKISVVLLKRSPPTDATKHLYALLSTYLWRRDLFAESEPVRLPSEFFGREALVNEILAKVFAGAPLALFGLRKIGKSSLLGRVEDMLSADSDAVCATAFLLGNSATLKGGRWWDAALDMIEKWQTKLQRIADRNNSKIRPKAERLREVLGRKVADTGQIASAFQKDILALFKSAYALRNELGRTTVRLVLIVDECDHLYPHIADSGHWRTDFFTLWNTIQATKRGLENPKELVYVLGGVNPSGVEQGTIIDSANPLFETQTIYLRPMGQDEATLLLRGLGERMGLAFSDETIAAIYETVGGLPLLLRRFGSAIHASDLHRSSIKEVTRGAALAAFGRRKREFYNQVTWTLEHLKRVAPDEERLLRDLALGGSQAYQTLWNENQFRETFAHHLERYGLVRFEGDSPVVALPLIRDALREPSVSSFDEQKEQLKNVVETIEQAIRARLCSDLERARTPGEAVAAAVGAIPSEAKNRALGRQQLLDLGASAGLSAVLESLNWGDYEILLRKFYDDIVWIGNPISKDDRLHRIKDTFAEAHLVRHNNNAKLKELIGKDGFVVLFRRFCDVRDMLAA